MNYQMFKLVLEKAEEPEVKLPTSTESWKKQESSRKTSISAWLTMLKPWDCVDHNKLWKILQEMGIPDHLTCLLRMEEGKGRMIWENSIETCILPYVKVQVQHQWFAPFLCFPTTQLLSVSQTDHVHSHYTRSLITLFSLSWMSNYKGRLRDSV